MLHIILTCLGVILCASTLMAVWLMWKLVGFVTASWGRRDVRLAQSHALLTKEQARELDRHLRETLARTELGGGGE